MGSTLKGRGGGRGGATRGLVPRESNAGAASEGGGFDAGGWRQDRMPGWPRWVRVVVSLVVVYHLAAIVAGAVGVPPSSELERAIADGFRSYFDVMDLGYSYRFYAEPPPTPVVTATLRFGDGRPEEVVRLPGREVAGPRMRYQRQLALANALFNNVQEARHRVRDASQSRLARAYARHLCRTRPGCRLVTIHVQQHLLPDIREVRRALNEPGATRFDLFAESLFSTPEWVGDYPCDDF
ncbi:MAG: hypothetical protein ACYC61_25875 [Isosphaeraceae bacterium]